MAKKNSSMAAQEADWQTESDLRTLIECEKIEKDPKRFKAAKDLAKKKMMEVAAVASSTETD